MTDTRLHLPAGQNFTCTVCGKCCRSWKVRVDPAHRSLLQTSPPVRQVEREGFVPLQVSDGETSLARREDGSCVFLRPDDLFCTIHLDMGPESKPLDCRTFPYQLTRTPDGYFASVSFVCPAVVEQYGDDVEVDRDSLEAMLQSYGDQVPQVGPVGEQVALMAGKWIPWAGYLELEEQLLRVFRPHDPVLSLLQAGVALVAQRDLAGPDLALELAPDEWLEAVSRLFVTNVLAVVELEARPDLRAGFVAALNSGEEVRSHTLGVTLPPFGVSRALDPLAASVVERYVINLVRGKKLLRTSFLRELLRLVCGLAVLCYYCEALKEADKAGSVTHEHLVRAFEPVEASIVTHGQGWGEFFEEFEAFLMAEVG